ncbi:ABC transporter ATP-binding protein [Leucobacter sp. GX24907]
MNTKPMGSYSGEDVGLSLQHLRKSYGKNTVLHDLSLEVERGKLLSLLGPSGCGKTTTLNMIAGFHEPDSGRILLAGEDITSAPPNRRDTAIVFQNYALFPHMTVADNISYGLKARRMPAKEIAARTHRMMELLDIGVLGKRYPGELSGGQQQRVALARAIAVQPSLLLLDEPLSNLDAKLRQEIRLEIRKLQQELGQTAVFVTHDQEEALVISDYIAVLNRGWLEQYGTPEDLWERPETTYVADFMGVENILAVEHGRVGVSIADGSRNQGVPVPVDRTDISHIGFRPAHARLSASEEPRGPSSAALVLEAEVMTRAYLGTSFRYNCEVHAPNGRALQIDQPIGDAQAEPGEHVRIVISTQGLLPLVASEAGARVVTEAVQQVGAAV